MQIEIKRQSPIEQGTLKSGRTKNLHSNKVATSQRILPLPDFAGLQARWRAQNQAHLAENENRALSSGWGEDVWGIGGGDFKQIEHYQFYRRVWDETDGLLYYPSVLAYHKISGTVNTRLVFHADGTCNWPAVQINSNQPYLRIYVLDLMSKLCRLNFKPYYRAQTSLNLDMSFTFSQNEKSKLDAKKGQERILGNVLTFFRHSQKNPLQWKLGPFTGMFPIPIVNLDFVWLKEKWMELAEDQNPFHEFKR